MKALNGVITVRPGTEPDECCWLDVSQALPGPSDRRNIYEHARITLSAAQLRRLIAQLQRRLDSCGDAE